ncbi:alkaline phosphatase family protein [Thermaerobacillus caldiproteolyticus]|uniref:alkaline phosphatase family protein n=1 Tax=Thermaerobacillus caldiproteolyticus TaxID=247480 RepID=UPI00188CCB2D|nr:alkaline phosphatase family protein [Anoxybacillus caldiproteolyticus]QPA29959.1 alkaline phosphatase family protein [Anoxybacillus caldiproteolyticus]
MGQIVSTYANKKRVIMLMIDSLMYPPLEKAVKEGYAPAFKFFIENGKVFPNIVSPFPTMSVTVDSSLLTGTHANIHKIPGLVWFHDAEKRLINYGSHIRELIKLGIIRSIKDIVYHMNNHHLSKEIKTIHEEMSMRGKGTASINALIYRGNTEHSLKLPRILTLFTSLNHELKTKGSQLFTYGSFSKLSPLKRNGYFWQRCGFNDRFSAQELKHLIETDSLPSFTIVYFPDMDKIVHKNGPMTIKGIRKVDRQLQSILDCYDSWEEALKDNYWIIMGDNAQAPIDSDRNKALIDLRQSLRSYQIMTLKDGVKDGDEIVLGVNERMAFIYTLNPERAALPDIAKTLQKDDRVDVIAWMEKESVHVISGVQQGKIIFKPNGTWVDEYEQSWDIEGDVGILNLTVKNNKIFYDEYPDALARLYSSLTSHEGNYLVVSAKPGFEFIGEGSPTHVGGASHGALHKQDSLVPMIVTGTDSSPKHLRMIDLKDWILTLLD